MELSNVPEQVLNSELLNIKVKSADGNEIYFRIKGTTPLKKLMLAYCQRKGVNPDTVRFLFDGKRLEDNSTPKELLMEDNDAIGNSFYLFICLIKNRCYDSTNRWNGELFL